MTLRTPEAGQVTEQPELKLPLAKKTFVVTNPPPPNPLKLTGLDTAFGQERHNHLVILALHRVFCFPSAFSNWQTKPPNPTPTTPTEFWQGYGSYRSLGSLLSLSFSLAWGALHWERAPKLRLFLGRVCSWWEVPLMNEILAAESCIWGIFSTRPFLH